MSSLKEFVKILNIQLLYLNGHMRMQMRKNTPQSDRLSVMRNCNITVQTNGYKTSGISNKLTIAILHHITTCQKALFKFQHNQLN